MGLQEYVAIVRKRWLSILLCAIVGLVASGAYVYLTKKVYTASAQLFVAASADSTAALNNGNSFAQARVQSYTSAASSPGVTDAVVRDLKLNMTPTELGNKITSDAPADKVILNVHVEDHSPTQAARLTNAVATQLVQYIEQIERVGAGGTSSPVKLSVLHPAQVPSSPSSPNVTIDVIIGIFAGLLIGVGSAVARTSLDTRIRTAEDVSDTADISVLASIPRERRSGASSEISRTSDNGQRAEAVRQLRTNLQYIAVDSPPKVFAVTSASRGEGKTTTAISLAFSLAEAGKRVCLVDADLRRPAIAAYLKLPSGAGLTSTIAGLVPPEDVLQQIAENLVVMTSGPLPPNPTELLGSTQFRSVVAALSKTSDYVIIDTAPILPVADGREVAAVVEATILIVAWSRTSRDQLRQAVQACFRVGANVSGIVLNLTSRRGSSTYDQYYSKSPAVEMVDNARKRAHRN